MLTVWSLVGSWNFPMNNGESPSKNLQSRCLPDDILITEKSEEEYLQNLNDVLHLLESSGLKLKKEKYKCMVPSITYLGYRIDSEASECVFVYELVS